MEEKELEELEEYKHIFFICDGCGNLILVRCPHCKNIDREKLKSIELLAKRD